VCFIKKMKINLICIIPDSPCNDVFDRIKENINTLTELFLFFELTSLNCYSKMIGNHVPKTS